MRLAVAASALALAGPAQAAEPPGPVVDASVTPSVAAFGDPVLLQVDVVVDPDAVDPSSLRLEADTAPLERVGGIEREETPGRDLAQVRFRVQAACATLACLQRAQPAPLRVVARRRDGTTVTVRQPWPALDVAARVSPEALTARAAAVDASLPDVRWRVDPGALAGVLVALALVLLATAAALVGVEVRRERQLRPASRGDALAVALAGLRRALSGDEPERRRAAGRVARVLRPRDGVLAPRAERLAWSPEPPAAGALAALADDVEREAK